MHKKALILNNKRNTFYFEKFESKEVDICSVSKTSSKVYTIIYKILKKLKLKQTRYFYDNWYKNLNKYEKIIILTSAIRDDYNIIENILLKYKNIKIFIFTWDSSKYEGKYEIVRKIAKKNNIKYYSFDQLDCKKYGFYFNTTMYDKRLGPSIIDVIKTDVLFVGLIKNRIDEILRIHNLLNEAKINNRFIVVIRNKKIKNLPFETSKKYIDYFEYIKMVKESKVILDLCLKEQNGLSLRIMEALFFDKKLITTNKEILNTKFYNSNNILYLTSKTTIKEIQEFMSKKFVPYDHEIKDYYSVESWVKRFEL